MKKINRWLLDFKSNVYSQEGEDGIISKIMEVLPENDKWCVEFGAWNGEHLSNTRNLIQNYNYSAILIESDKKKFDILKKRDSGNKKIIVLNKFVGFMPSDNLDQILEENPIPRSFDFLSIDVDGNDYHIWKAMNHYQPKVVCIEFNPTIPTRVNYVQPADPSVCHGASLMALVELGKAKGYELISVVRCNAFFVLNEYYSYFSIDNNDPEILREHDNDVTYLYSFYDGTIHLSGNKRLPWHGIDIVEQHIQHIPKIIRKYPDNYKKIEKWVFVIWKSLFLLRTNPTKLFIKVFGHHS